VKDNVVNLFQTAKEVPPTKQHPLSAGVDGKTGTPVVDLGDSLSTLASVKVVIKSLEALATQYDAVVKAKMAAHFAAIAVLTGKRPPNFKGVSDRAEASCELRRRSSSSYLSKDEAALLEAMDIPVAEAVVQDEIPERYFFNPSIVASGDLAGKISKALATVKELEGVDVILRQPAEPAITRKYVPDSALDAVAATKDEQMIKELLPIVSSLAIRVKLLSSELGEAINLLKAADVNLG